MSADAHLAPSLRSHSTALLDRDFAPSRGGDGASLLAELGEPFELRGVVRFSSFMVQGQIARLAAGEAASWPLRGFF